MTEGAISRPFEGLCEKDMEYSQPIVALDATKHGATSVDRPGWVNASHGNTFQHGNQVSVAIQQQWASTGTGSAVLCPSRVLVPRQVVHE